MACHRGVPHCLFGAGRTEGRVPAQRRIWGHSPDPQRRVHVVDRISELRGTDMKRSGKLVSACVAGACVLGAVEMASAEERAPSMAEFQKLQAEVRDQRQLIIQLIQSEQQRYDMLLKLLQTGGGPSGERAAAAAAAAPAVGAPPATSAPASRGVGPLSDVAARREQAHATIEGTVKVNGGDADAVYVYVDNVKGPPVRGKKVQIKQEGKQFTPAYAVVQVGTQLDFPNQDSIFHNVFSQSPRNSFDLGAY